mgnify:FL=1
MALVLPACRPEEDSPQGRPLRFVDIPVSLSCEGDTRSMVDIGVEDFQKAALFAFDAGTGLLLENADAPVVAFPTRKEFNWSLPENVDMDIYVIVNYGEEDLASFAREGLHESELEALRFTSETPSALKRLETEGFGLPMAGVRRSLRISGSGQSLTLTVKKLYAKYNLYFDLSQIQEAGWQVQAMHMIVENANTEVPYFIEGYRQEDPAHLVEYDRATEWDLDEIQQGGSGHAVTLYMLENCQGHKEGAESWKTVYKDLGFEALRNCTYIDLSVKLRRASGEYQDLGYAIYLGQTDMRTDFDIVRNLFKTIRIVLPGPGEETPASRFFRFSGTESPTVTPGETIDLYFVTNLEKTDLSATCSPQGVLTVKDIAYTAGEDGVATGYVRLLAGSGIEDGDTCLVTAGSAAKDATDQRKVTASWPTVLRVDLSEAPAYVAQTGYLRIDPDSGVVRVDASVKSGSESILKIGAAGVSGSIMQIGLSALSAGSGTVVLHAFNTAGAEIVTQEVELTVLAPLPRFGMDLYNLLPDGTAQKGILQYRRSDGSAFSQADLARFDPDLVKQLLFPTSWIEVLRCDAYVKAVFTRDSEQDRSQLTIPIQMQVERLTAQGHTLEWADGESIGALSYCGAPSANLPAAEAGLTLVNPFASTAGTVLGIIENNLPVHEALLGSSAYLSAQGVRSTIGLEIKSYREGKTFSYNGSELTLELPLQIQTDVSAEVEGIDECSIQCQGKTLVLTALEHPAAYTGYGRKTLYARIRHSATGELTEPVEMGDLECYLIGAVGPYIHGSGPYQVGGCLVPAGNRSPIAALGSGCFPIGENSTYTEKAVTMHGLYPTSLSSYYHLYHQYDEIDDHGVEHYASQGETSWLNAFQIRTGTWPLGTDVMEFRFGSIFQGHGCGMVDAAWECDRMLCAFPANVRRKGNLFHFPDAGDKDAEGFSYCAVVNLFGGNGGSVYDLFIDMDGQGQN